MRIDVKKFLFIGIHHEVDAFFLRAQQLGVIQFVSKHGVKAGSASALIEEYIHAIKVLRSLPTTVQEDFDEVDAPKMLAKAILSLRHTINDLEEKIRTIDLEIARVRPFGDFSLEDIAYIEQQGHRKLQFFCGKKGRIIEDLPDSVLFVSSEEELDYYVGISPQSEGVSHPSLVEMHIEQPVGALRRRRAATADKLQGAHAQLKPYARYNSALHQALAIAINSHTLQEARSFAAPAVEGALFLVSGWVPADKTEALRQLAQQMHIYVDEVLPDAGEVAPTYLENAGACRIGEDLVHVYDTPSNSDKDPSLWVLVWFSLFFAMIVGDGGYGAIFLAIALYVRYKSGRLYGFSKRMWSLTVILFSSCIVWGFLAGSFFGISLANDNPLRSYSLTHWLAQKKAAYHMVQEDETWHYWVEKYPEKKEAATGKEFLAPVDDSVNELLDKFNDHIMMELALFIGCIHISTSLLRYCRRNLTAIGWFAFIVGAYCYLPYFLGATSLIYYVFGLDMATAAHEGVKLMIGGVTFSLVVALILHKFIGMLEIMQPIQIFSDVLSYLRLYALGLAGGIVSAIVNEFALMSGWVLGAALLIAGHLFNMILALMGGIIHGLRLNFLEWYRYSFEGGGKIFQPLCKISNEIK